MIPLALERCWMRSCFSSSVILWLSSRSSPSSSPILCVTLTRLWPLIKPAPSNTHHYTITCVPIVLHYIPLHSITLYYIALHCITSDCILNDVKDDALICDAVNIFLNNDWQPICHETKFMTVREEKVRTFLLSTYGKRLAVAHHLFKIGIWINNTHNNEHVKTRSLCTKQIRGFK